MPVLPEPEFITLALGTSEPTRLGIRAFDDAVFSSASDVTGETAKLFVAISGAAWKEYDVIWDDETTGEGHVDLDNTVHTEAGQFPAQLQHQGVLKRRYTLEFVESAT